MHVVVVGCGRVGSGLAISLTKEGHSVAIMDKNPSRFMGDKLPVESVTWLEAKEFCMKLSKKEGKEYTLPTEAEMTKLRNRAQAHYLLGLQSNFASEVCQ